MPGFVEGSQNAIVNPAAGVTPPTPAVPEKYPSQIVTPDEAAGKTSVVDSASAAPVAAAPTVAEPQSKDGYQSWVDSLFPSADQKAKASTAAAGPDIVPDDSGSTRINAVFNNPGALGLAGWESKYGAVPSGKTDTGHSFAQFPTKEAGGAAQFELWTHPQFLNQTLKNAITNWIGPGEQGEAEFISQKTGIPLNQPITEDLLKSPMGIRLMQAQAQYEGANVLTQEHWQRAQDWAYRGVTPTGVAGVASTAAPAEKQLGDDWIKLSPEDQAAAEKEGQARVDKVFNDIREKNPNMPSIVRMLEHPIAGISDDERQRIAADFKQQITTYAQEYYKEKDPDKAYARIMQGPDWNNLWGATTFFGEIGTKFFPNVAHAGLSMAQAATDNSPLLQFINIAQPDASPESRTALVKQVMAKPDSDRNDFIKHLYAHLTPDQAQNVDLNSLLNWSDTISQPGVREAQAKMQENIKAAVAQNRKDLRMDPTLQGTLGGTAADSIAAAPKNFAEGVVPGIGQSVIASEIYSDTLDGLRQDHPDWTEDQLKAKAAAVTIPQSMLQELINLGTMGIGGSLFRGISNPIARMFASAVTHGTIAAGAGAAQQGVANWAEGKPWTKDIGEAAVGAGVQGLAGGLIGGARHGPEVRPEYVPPEPPLERPYSQYRPAEPKLGEHGPPTRADEPFSQYNPPEPVLREHGPPDVTGPEFGPAKPISPVARADILGPEETGIPPMGERWHDPGPIVTRGVERGTFTPQELSQAVNRLSDAGMSPDQIHQVISQLRPGYEQGLQSVHLGAEGGLEAARTRTIQANQPPIPTKFPLMPRKGDIAQPPLEPFSGLHTIPASAIAQARMEQARARAEAKLSGGKTTAAPVPSAPTPEPPPPRPGNISGEDPHITREAKKTTVNGVANIYQKVRTGAGELPPIDPNVGVTTEELLARGARMGPEEVNQHISDIMSEKGGDLRKQAAAMRIEELRLTHKARRLSIEAEENPHNAQAKLDYDNASKDLADFHHGAVKKMKKTFHDAGVGLQGELGYDLSTYEGLRDKFFQENNNQNPPLSADPVIKDTAARVRQTHSNEYKAKKRLSAEVDKWLGKKMSDEQIEETRQAALKKMNIDPC